VVVRWMFLRWHRQDWVLLTRYGRRRESGGCGLSTWDGLVVGSIDRWLARVVLWVCYKRFGGIVSTDCLGQV
jgi:hypothetical protein